MRASVDPDVCAGHGACVEACPGVFDLTDGGYAEVTVEAISDDDARLVELAASRCPERAITIHTE